MEAPWNLKWHDELLATGGMINNLDRFAWLTENNISCVISLDEYPDFIGKKMSEAHMSQAFHLVTEVGEPPIEELSDFIAGHIVDERKVYIHCSAGASRSPKLARAFMAKKDFYIARYLAKRANDLNHGDDFDWMRGHCAFSGDTLGKAISALEKGLESEDEKTLFYASDTLIELMEHATFDTCFDSHSVQRLRDLTSKALGVAIKVNPKHTDAYIEILNRFDPPKY